MKQIIIERPITEWEGVIVRVEISHPKLPNTVTTQMVLDKHMMDEIVHLTPPENLEFLMVPEKIFEYDGWKEKNKRAHDMVNMISKTIANHLLRILEKEIKKERNEK